MIRDIRPQPKRPAPRAVVIFAGLVVVACYITYLIVRVGKFAGTFTSYDRLIATDMVGAAALALFVLTGSTSKAVRFGFLFVALNIAALFLYGVR